jgi:hypothetical protein
MVSEKGNPMSWDQIESKWAEMVRRVQPAAAKRGEEGATQRVTEGSVGLPQPSKPDPANSAVE